MKIKRTIVEDVSAPGLKMRIPTVEIKNLLIDIGNVYKNINLITWKTCLYDSSIIYKRKIIKYPRGTPFKCYKLDKEGISKP